MTAKLVELLLNGLYSGQLVKKHGCLLRLQRAGGETLSPEESARGCWTSNSLGFCNICDMCIWNEVWRPKKAMLTMTGGFVFLHILMQTLNAANPQCM
jgi:hypothetical protein